MNHPEIHVLLIEDNPDDALLIRELLREASRATQSFESTHVERLSTGLTRLAENEVDVLLLGLSLPDSHGLSSLVHARLGAPDVPIVVLSGLEDEATAIRAVQEGAQDYLVKGEILEGGGTLLARSLRYAIERKRVAAALQDSEERYRSMIEQNADGIVIVDERGIVSYINPAAEVLFGRPAGDLVGTEFGFPVTPSGMTELDIHRRSGGSAELVIAEMRVVKTEWANETAYLASLRDITERKRGEDELRYRVEFDKLVTEISTLFVRIAPDDIAVGVNSALQAVGEFTAVDRTCLFLYSTDGSKLYCTHEWCAEGIPLQIEHRRVVSVQRFPWWAERLNPLQTVNAPRLQAVHIPRVVDMPAEAAAEREFLESQGVQSFVAVPMVHGRSLKGFVGFESVRAEKSWTKDTIAQLGMVGEIFINAMERARLQETIQRRATEMSILYNVSRVGLTSIHLDEILNGTVDALKKAFPADRIAILLVEPETNELVIRASSGFAGGQKPAAFPIGVGIPGWVVKTGQPVLLADVRGDERYLTGDPDTISNLCAPLQFSERVIGAVNLESHREAAFDKNAGNLLSVLAGHLAAVIMNFRLFEESEQLKLFNESIVQGIAETVLLEDAEGTITFANRAAAELLGTAGEELVGLHWSDLIPEDEVEKVRAERAKCAEGIASRHETALLSKDGRLIPVIVSARPLMEDHKFTGVLAAFTDITERKALEEMWKRYEFIVNSSDELMALVSKDYVYEAVNESYRRSHASGRGEILGSTVAQVWGEETFNAAIKEHLEKCFAGDTVHYARRFEFADMGRRHMHVTYYPYYNSAGSVTHAVVVSRDITEQKQAQEQIEAALEEKIVLLKEVHHRVKNNLQVISSLLDLQSGYVKDEDARRMFHESRNRVKSMALIHERLYQAEDLAQVDFGEYAQGLVESLFRSYRVDTADITLTVNVEDVLLNVETAIPCGLIVNELVSNALKYGFPDGRSGEIWVELFSDDGEFTLAVRDNGIGIRPELDLRRTKSLGLKLVTTLTRQLRGSLELDRDGGTEFRITFSARERGAKKVGS